MDIPPVITVLIPIFTSQLEKSREAVDAANIRAAYAEVMTAALTGDTTNYSKEVEITQKDAEWRTTIDWPKEIEASAQENVTVGGKATITFTPASTGSTGGTVTVSYGS